VIRCYEVAYSVLDFSGFAVCGHISVSMKTDFSFFQSVPYWRWGDQAIHAVGIGWGVGGGGAKHPGREADHSPSRGQRARRSE